MTAPSWAEARKAEDAAHYDVVLANRVQVVARRAVAEEQNRIALSLKSCEAKYRRARHASDVALVRRVLAYAESVCESRRTSLHDSKQIMAALEAGKCGMAIVGRDPAAVLAEIQKEESNGS